MNPPTAGAVERLAGARRLLVASDYDGVLAPIVDRPHLAVPTPGVVALLEAMTTLPETTAAIVSGRSMADLLGFVGPAPGVELIGSHGAERRGHPPAADPGDAALRARLDRAASTATELVPESLGYEHEPKPTALAVHFRNADSAHAETAIPRLIDAVTATGLLARHGKKVVEFIAVEVDKGTALARLRAELEADAVLFMGDDRTDEDAFRRLGDGDLTVKVGPGPTAARWRIPDPAAAAGLLEEVLMRRSSALAAS